VIALLLVVFKILLDVFAKGGSVFVAVWGVAKALYGVTRSAAGSLALVDVGHILVLSVGYIGTALSVAAMVADDTGKALALVAAGVATLVTAAQKWASPASKAPLSPASTSVTITN
jgi:hypothetical protein